MGLWIQGSVIMKYKATRATGQDEIEIDGQNSSLKSNNKYVWRDEKATFLIKNIGSKYSPDWGVLFGEFEGIIFPANRLTQVWVNYHIDHDIALETKLYPHVHWMPIDNNTGIVRWGFEYTIAKGHGQSAFFQTTKTVYVNQAIPANSRFKHMIAEVSDVDAILSSEIEPDSVVMMRVFRDGGNDTYASGVRAWQADLHYQVARIGTVNKSPNFIIER